MSTRRPPEVTEYLAPTGDLQAAELHAVVTAVTGVVGDRDLAPGQAGQLMVQRGLVAFTISR